jgi:hypothetical protein
MEFMSFPGEEQETLKNFIESLPLLEDSKKQQS